MNPSKAIATYRRLRSQPLWRLLVADNGPVILSLLQALHSGGGRHPAGLSGEERNIPASIFCERMAKDIVALRSQGEEMPQTAQAYIADWLAAGYLARRLSRHFRGTLPPSTYCEIVTASMAGGFGGA